LPLVAKVGICLGFIVFIGIAYFTIFYNDVATAVTSAKSQEVQLLDRLAQAEKAKHAYDRDQAELEERKQRQRDLNKVLPKDAAYPAFLSAVQMVADASGVSLVAWSPMEESSEEFYAKVPMKLKLTGRFHQIAKFFHGVGQLDRIINIEDIDLGKPKVVNDDVILEVECLATAFRSLPPQPVGQQPAKPKAAAGKNPKK